MLQRKYDLRRNPALMFNQYYSVITMARQRIINHASTNEEPTGCVEQLTKSAPNFITK